jgi:hypothetical protein
MRNFLIVLSVSWLSLHSFTASAFMLADTVLYEQKLNRFYWSLRENTGKIFVTDHHLIFKAKKTKSSFMNFAVRYNQIERIRRANALLIFPNVIRIKTKNGRKYILGTYRRKKIIELTRQKMNELKAGSNANGDTAQTPAPG